MLFRSIFVFLLLRFSSADYCPPDYQPIPDQGLCIFMGMPTKNDGSFDSARHQCALNGAFTPNITNVYMNNVLAPMGNSLNGGRDSSFFIGVVKNDAGVWTYADGGTLYYSRWASGEPRDCPECSCAVMDNSTYWYARDCSQPSSYSCLTWLQSSAPGCPPGWIAFQGWCYFLKDITLDDDGNWVLYNFTEAQMGCAERSSQLVSIHSQAESDFIYDLVYAKLVNETDAGYNHPCDWGWTWIGLAHSPSPNTTYWLDGTPLDYCGFGAGDCVIAEIYDCGFQVHNDVTCYPKQAKVWNWWLAGFHYLRYICKKSIQSNHT